jgi:hypothetical protein
MVYIPGYVFVLGKLMQIYFIRTFLVGLGCKRPVPGELKESWFEPLEKPEIRRDFQNACKYLVSRYF